MSTQGPNSNKDTSTTLIFSNTTPLPNFAMLAFQDAVTNNALEKISSAFLVLVTEFESNHGLQFAEHLRDYLYEVCENAVKTCPLETVIRLFNLECQDRRLLKEMHKDLYINLMLISGCHETFLYLLTTAPDNLTLLDFQPFFDGMPEQQYEAVRGILTLPEIEELSEEELDFGVAADSDDDLSDGEVILVTALRRQGLR